MTEVLRLKKSNCKNCYKCIRHCPVKSIRFSGNQAHIIPEDCILCGHCFVVCPQNAKEIFDGTETLKVFLQSGQAVVASVAPSFAAAFPGVGFSAFRETLQKLGFDDAEETAIGATLVKREYEKQIAEASSDVIITSCCHSVNLLIRKYYPQLLPFLSPVVTPMVAHSLDIKRRRPDVRTVFIGPCVAKKDEALISPVDLALTFEEISQVISEANLSFPQRTDENDESRARLFPLAGGILKTMDIPPTDYTVMVIDGVDHCMAALNDIAAGDITKTFIEMSACSGSCIGGPIMEKYKNSPIRHYRAVSSYAGAKDFPVDDLEAAAMQMEYMPFKINPALPTEAEINEILERTGKSSESDYLNCGSCGYDTCREKAIAVFQGKADIEMCLPYLMNKSEHYAKNVIENSMDGILILNESFEIQLINNVARKLFRIRQKSDVLGQTVVSLMHPLPFVEALNNPHHYKTREYFADLEKYLELRVRHDSENHLLIASIRDVSEIEESRRKKREIGRQTVATADAVVTRQMRIVQEIASLLGETAAETKIALTKLKDSIHDQMDEEE